mmetsp:Transcript_14242/g.25200  ORF Transcript_14242/g.25200 Transcript_14242/m.25200 type:complete len:118 (+) Transcript_14242:701-1054(+)
MCVLSAADTGGRSEHGRMAFDAWLAIINDASVRWSGCTFRETTDSWAMPATMCVLSAASTEGKSEHGETSSDLCIDGNEVSDMRLGCVSKGSIDSRTMPPRMCVHSAAGTGGRSEQG